MQAPRFAPGLLAALVFGGCAWVHQDAQLRLDPQMPVSNVGNGAALAVRVIDRRDERIIGYRGLDSKNASITTEQDLSTLVQQKLVEGFSRKGFRASVYLGELNSALTVELRQLNYTTDMDFWKGIVQTTCTLRVVTSRNGLSFDQTYVGTRKETTVEAPSAKTNDRLISAAMSTAVQRILEDDRLAFFLVN
jgi:uncharacterized lipoprotein YajG